MWHEKQSKGFLLCSLKKDIYFEILLLNFTIPWEDKKQNE